jgi:hypothetical protein
MAHDHSAMHHAGVEAMSPTFASQACRPNCASADWMAAFRKTVPYVRFSQTDSLVVDAAAALLASDRVANWLPDGTPPEPPGTHVPFFKILRI